MKKNVHGEGNYEATREYNSRTKKFIDAGRVDAAAKAAAPRTAAEADEMKQAEMAALQRAKGDEASAAKTGVDHADAASTAQALHKARSATPVQKR